MSISPKSPKVCQQCGARGGCVDSRSTKDYVRRRYRCKCGNGWTTVELFVEEDVASDRFKIQRFRARQGDEGLRTAIAKLQELLPESFP